MSKVFDFLSLELSTKYCFEGSCPRVLFSPINWDLFTYSIPLLYIHTFLKVPVSKLFHLSSF